MFNINYPLSGYWGFAKPSKRVTFEELIQRADLIFTGTLESVEIIEVSVNDKETEFQKMTFQINRNYLEPKNTSEIILFESNSTCSYNFKLSLERYEHNNFLIFGFFGNDEKNVFAPYKGNGALYFTGYCSGSFSIDPPDFNFEHLPVDEKLYLIDAYFDAGLKNRPFSPDELYNEIWKDRIFHWFYTHEKPTHPEGFWAERDYFQKWLQPCGVNEIEKEEWMGVVHVSFTVTKEGELKDLVPFTFGDSICNDEAIRVVEKMPRWKPAKVHGIPVSARTSVMVDFREILE